MIAFVVLCKLQRSDVIQWFFSLFTVSARAIASSERHWYKEKNFDIFCNLSRISVKRPFQLWFTACRTHFASSSHFVTDLHTQNMSTVRLTGLYSETSLFLLLFAPLSCLFSPSRSFFFFFALSRLAHFYVVVRCGAVFALFVYYGDMPFNTWPTQLLIRFDRVGYDAIYALKEI